MSILHRIRWLLYGGALVLAAMLATSLYTGTAIDGVIVSYLTLALLAMLLVMLLATRQWTPRGAGVFYTVLGFAVLALADLVGWEHESLDDLFRACWTVGPSLVLVGYIQYGWAWWRARHDPPDRPP